MNLQDFHAPLQVRSVYNDTAVKTSRTEQCGIQYLRTVGCRKNQKTLGSIKSIHLSQKLVQRLLTLVISSAIAGITAFTYGIDLINKYNTGCILLGFFKQVADTGCTYTYKHLHKFRTGK